MSMSPFGSPPGQPGPYGQPGAFGQPESSPEAFGPPQAQPESAPRTLEHELFGPNSPLNLPPSRRFPWGPVALGVAVLALIGGVVAVLSVTSNHSSNSAAVTSTTPAAPTEESLHRLLLQQEQLPDGWKEDTATESQAPTGPNTSTIPACSTAFSNLYQAYQSPLLHAETDYSAPPAVPTSAPVPPAPAAPVVAPPAPGAPLPPPPAPAAPPPPAPRPGPPPPPPAPVNASLGVSTSVATFPTDTAAANYKLRVDTLLECPNFSQPNGAKVALTEGDDANTLGDESTVFHADITSGTNTVHAILWYSRSASRIWTMQYTYSGSYDRNEEKKILRAAVADWRRGIRN